MERYIMTYEIITPESAEQGGVAEHGFCGPGGWRYPFPVSSDGLNPEPAYVSLRDALRDLGSLEPNDSNYLDARWWSEVGGTPDYSDGSGTRKAIHLPDNITPSSRRRVNRLIKAGKY